MKVPIYISWQSKVESNTKFQRDHWDKMWGKKSFFKLVQQLVINPVYWELKEIISKRDYILEAGCGVGQWVWMLSKQGYKIMGVDFAKRTINKMHQQFPDLDIRFGDVKKLPFPDNKFDVYLSFGVIEHYPEGPDLILNEAFRILKNNGRLFLTIPYLNKIRLIRFKYFQKTGDRFYQYLYDEQEIKKIITKAGFKIDKIKKYDFINAISKDFPWSKYLINKPKLVMEEIRTETRINFEELLKVKKPKFWLNSLLYRLDSYILLIEARKIDQ